MLHYPFSSFLLIHPECDNQYVEPLIQEVYAEMDRLQTEEVSPEELQQVKSYMIGELCRNYESAFAIADAWMFAFTSDLDDEYFQRSLEGIKNTSAADILDLAQRYLRKEELKVSIAGEQIK